MPTAIQAMRTELQRVQREQGKCVNRFGRLWPHRRLDYMKLVIKAREFKDSIEWLEERVYKIV